MHTAAGFLEEKLFFRIEKMLHRISVHLSKHGSSPTTFSLFVSFTYMLPYFMQGSVEVNKYNWVLGIKSPSILLCVGLIFRKQWKNPWRKYFPLYYYFTLGYCLPFTTTFLFLLGGSQMEWIVNVTLAILLLIVLTDWRTFVVLTISGIALALGVYKIGIGPIHLHLDVDTAYTLVYAIVFSTLIGLLFARRKQQRVEHREQDLRVRGDSHRHTLLETERARTETLQALQQQRADQMLDLLGKLKEIKVADTQRDEFEQLQAELIPMAFQLHGLDKRAAGYVRLSVQSFDLKTWLQRLRDQALSKTTLQSLKIILHSQTIQVKADPEQLTNLLLERISALCNQRRENPDTFEEDEPVRLQLTVQDAALHYPLSDVGPEYVKKVPALRFVLAEEDTDVPTQLDGTFTPDLTAQPTAPAQSARAVSKATSLRILQAHYGHYEETEACCTVVIPQDVSQVRPRDVDKPYMATGATLIRANDRYRTDAVDAQQEEHALFAEIQDKSSVSTAQVKTALELIKWYHGPMPRKTNEPFYLHPVAVARIVLDYDTSDQAVLGALLHDTVEDTWIRLQEIEKVFGKETADVVDLVTHLQKVEGSLYRICLSTQENLSMLERTGNRAALCVKLADRMHNMRTIAGHDDPKKRQTIAQETLDFFVPLARKLGLQEAAQEFTTRGRAVLDR